jgi:glycosyl transferase family 2
MPLDELTAIGRQEPRPMPRSSASIESPTTPLVSVGLPTYNRAAQLKRAIESVLSQDYANLELIISDNRSTDETESVCREICAMDNRVRYIQQPGNLGPVINFHKVLQNARGEFFMWLGDDDWLEPFYVSTCVRYLMANPDYSLVCGADKYFRGGRFLLEGETIKLTQASSKERVLIYYRQVVYNGTFYGLMRLKQLRSVGVHKTLGGDWLMIASIAFLGKIRTLEGISVNRTFEGVSRNVEQMCATLGVSPLRARKPYLSIALSAFADIARKSDIYKSIGAVGRFCLGCHVVWIFFRRFCLQDWHDSLYPYGVRPLLFGISVRDVVKATSRSFGASKEKS